MGEGVAVFDERMWMGRDPRLTWIRMEDMVPLCMIWRESDPNPLIHLLAETMTQELEQHDTPRRSPTSLRREGQ